jgi:hypothetical protein
MSSDSESEKSAAQSRRPSYYGGEDKGVTNALQKAMARLKEKERERAENPPQLSYLYLQKSASFELPAGAKGVSSFGGAHSPERGMVRRMSINEHKTLKTSTRNASFDLDGAAKRRPDEEEQTSSPIGAVAAQGAQRIPRHVSGGGAYFASSVPNLFRKGYNASFDSEASTNSNHSPDPESSSQSSSSEPGARWLSYTRSFAHTKS